MLIQAVALSVERTPVAVAEHLVQGLAPRQRMTFETSALTLAAGRYHLSLAVHSADRKTPLVWYHAYTSFRVEGSDYTTPSVLLLGSWSRSVDGS